MCSSFKFVKFTKESGDRDMRLRSERTRLAELLYKFRSNFGIGPLHVVVTSPEKE